MSLQCPRCSFIASLLSSRAPVLRSHTLRLRNPPSITPLTTRRPLSSTQSLHRDYKGFKKYEEQKLQDKFHASKAIHQRVLKGEALYGKERRMWAEYSEFLESQGRDLSKEQAMLKAAIAKDMEKLTSGFDVGSSPVTFRPETRERQIRPQDRLGNNEKLAGISPQDLFDFGNMRYHLENPDKPAKKESETSYPNQVSRTVRARLEQQWRQREEDHKARFRGGFSVEETMEKLIENITWRNDEAGGTAASQTYYSGADDVLQLDPENFATRTAELAPGTLFEVRYTDSSIPFLVVLLKNKTGNFSREAFVLGTQGALQLTKADMAQFSVANFIPEENINRLLSYIETHGRLDNKHVQEITLEIRKFKAQAQTLFSDYSSRVVELHYQLADSSEAKMMTGFELAKMVAKKENPDNYELYATHLALLRNSELYSIVDDFDPQTTKWEISPNELVARTKKVEALIRGCIENPDSRAGKDILGFVEKARKIIEYSREARKLGKSVEEMDEPLDVVWNPLELEILRTLDETLDYKRGDSKQLKSLYPHILGLVNRYEKDRLLNEQRLFEFLGEVGACSPWEDSVIRDRHLGLPGHHTNHQADEWGKLYQDVEKPGGIEKLGLVDNMANIRHDWKDLPVYCVDDASTREIDDGISIEKIDGTEDVWLHVHIANPTAFIPMDHWIAEIARHKVSTFYSPQRNYSMLPLSLSIEKLGLSKNRPAMTFSLRIDGETKEVKDYKIRASTVHNVKRLTYDELNELSLGEKFRKSLILSNAPVESQKIEVASKPSSDITLADRENLKDLYKFAWGMRLRRMKNGALEASLQSELKVSVNNGHGNIIHPGIQEKPILDVHKPIIKISVQSRIKSGETFWWQDVIREYMTGAGNMAAKWSAERNMGQMYRHHDFQWQSEKERDYWYEMLKKATNEEGYTSDDFWKLFLPAGQGKLSPEMGIHRAMGMDGYIKVTSPLRRFGDFISHHIIGRRLLAEAGDTELMKPLFTDEQLSALCAEVINKEREYNSAEKASERLWTIRLLKELWENNDPQLAELQDITIIAISKDNSPMSGQIAELGLAGIRVTFPSNLMSKVRYGDVIKAKLNTWHWSTDSNNVQILFMDYVDYKETMEDRKAKFFRDVGEGEIWVKDGKGRKR